MSTMKATGLVEEARRTMDAVHARERQVLHLALQFVEGLSRHLNAVESQPRTPPTHADVVATVLEAAAPTALTVREIAARSTIPETTVRALLYTDRDRFRAQKVSPKVVKWALAGAEVAEGVPA